MTEVDGSDHTVLADPNQLEQVIINLAANAKAAMPDGGTLTIGIRRASEELSRGLSGEAPHGWIELRIADDGMGMDPEVMSRIFEPFFTTKPQGEGTGLGLATVLGIVGQSGGHVRVESTPGEGTSFRIYLPVQTETEIEAVLEKAERSATPAAGSGCVLLVEDEELVRISTQRTLEAAGYRVIAAANGERGLQLFRENSDEIAIVLTDMVMLNMSGTELSEAIHREHPDLPVIIMSGYTADQDAIRGSKAHFVSKPFSPQLLTEEIEALLRS